MEKDHTAGASTAHGGYNDDLIVIYRGKGTKAYGESGNDRMISYETANRTYLYGGAGIDRLQGTSATVTDDGTLGLDPVLGLVL